MKLQSQIFSWQLSLPTRGFLFPSHSPSAPAGGVHAVPSLPKHCRSSPRGTEGLSPPPAMSLRVSHNRRELPLLQESPPALRGQPHDSLCSFPASPIPEKPHHLPPNPAPARAAVHKEPPAPSSLAPNPRRRSLLGSSPLSPPAPASPPLYPNLISCCLLVEEEIKVILMDASPAEACLRPPCLPQHLPAPSR